MAAQKKNRRALEEQTLPFYHQKQYYPVKVGEILHRDYRILAKLGYGAYSTVWLAKDQRSNRYKTLKVCIRHDSPSSPVLREVQNMEHLREVARTAEHPGVDFTRLATDVFEVDGPSGSHFCVAADPQGSSLRTAQETFPNARLPKALVKSLVHRLLFSINWLHANCGVIHSDISPQNVLTKSVDNDVGFGELEDQYLYSRESVPLNATDGPAIYPTQVVTGSFSGIPILADFGQMRKGNCLNDDWAMPDLYRAPEVLFGLPWSYPVDLWSVGVMTLELLEGKNLFDPIDRVNSQYILPLALAQYIAYLGPPPSEMVRRSPTVTEYFDGEGRWSSLEPSIPKTSSLEDFVTTFSSAEEKELFLRFIRKLLTWDGDSRATSDELIEDEWLMDVRQ